MLLAGAYPGSSGEDALASDLNAILDAGIRSVMSLVEEDEGVGTFEGGDHFLPYADQLEALGEERGVIVEIQNHAIGYRTVPTDQEMSFLLDAVDAEIDGRNSPTLIHCSDGHGRSALVVGCYLARHGIAEGKGVIEKIKELRATVPGLADHNCPDNIVQERFVTRWKKDK